VAILRGAAEGGHPRPRCQGGQPFQQLQRIEAQMRRAVRPAVPERQPDLAVTGPVQPLLRQGRPQRVATHPLQPIAVARSNHEPGMQIEAVGARVTGPQRGRRDLFWRVAALADARAGSRPECHAPVDRRGRHRRQDRRLLRPRIRALAVLGAARESAPLDQPRDAPRDPRHHVSHVLAHQPRNRMRPHGATTVREHAVQHERVQMHIEIQRPTEALHNHHGAAATIIDAIGARAAPKEAEHRADGDAADRATQVVIPGQQVPQAMRQAQDPLTHRHIGQDVIDQVRCPLRHAPAAAARAEAAPLAREGNQSIEPTGGTPKTSEAAGQAAAPQEITKLLLDKPRQPVATPQRCGLVAKGLEMVPDDPEEDRGRRIARLVGGRWLRHAPWRGALHATPRDP
jgi:hypothetical protein